ncbi:MAG: 5-oxoprolinase subunit PxpA [Pseudomonadota bacterium]
MPAIDLNADLGESCDNDEALLAIVSSANVACGGHAGDADTMATTVRLAIINGVAIGAHPGYPDRDGFGRTSGFMAGDELYASLTEQVTALADIAAPLGAALAHVKPHGALYHDAIADRDLADIIARVTAEAPGTPALMGMANSAMQRAAEQHGLNFIAEGFVDRAYEPDGTLVSRSEPGAVHTDLNVATTQALRIAKEHEVTARDGSVITVQAETLCIHGDTPGAAEAARAVRDVLETQGVEVRAHPDR